MKYLAVITLLALALAQPVAAQSIRSDHDAGWDAWFKNDYVTALKHFRLAAKKGHTAESDVVLQDLVMAYVWFNMAATNGYLFAPKDRDKVLERLNASERRLALKLSKRCFKKPASCPEYSDD